MAAHVVRSVLATAVRQRKLGRRPDLAAGIVMGRQEGTKQ